MSIPVVDSKIVDQIEAKTISEKSLLEAYIDCAKQKREVFQIINTLL